MNFLKKIRLRGLVPTEHW